MSYTTESQKIHSRKTTLVTLEPTKRLQVWTNYSGSIYYKDVDYYVLDLRENTTSLTSVASIGAISSAGKYFFDESAKRVYVRTTGSVDPGSVFISVKYKMCFSTMPCILPYDLSTGFEVEFDGRVKDTSEIKQEIDPQELFGIALDGSCSVTLINQDGFFDDIYDTYSWENCVMSVYNWFPSTPITQAKIMFYGFVNSKKFTSSEVSFSAGDFVYQLNDFVKNGEFSSSDGTLDSSTIGTSKPRIYGRMAGKKLIGVDKILDGYSGTGTLAGTIEGTTITGTSTLFLDELCQGDTIVVSNGIDTFDYEVKSISSNTSLEIGSELDLNLALNTFTIKPARPWRKKNREWFLSGHKLREPVPTVSAIIDTNRYTLSSTTDIFPEDLLDFDGTLYRVRRVVDNDIVLYSAVQGTVLVNDVVRKSPINTLQYYTQNKTYLLIENRDFTITNNSTKCQITLADDAELNFFSNKRISAALTFTSSSRTVSTSAINLLDYVKPNDFISSDSISHTTYYEVLQIAEDGTSLTLKTAYAGSTVTTSAFNIKAMDAIGDDAIIVADCYGYEDAGVWIRTASDAVKHLIENDASLTGLNTTKFQEADDVGFYTISYSVPFQGSSKTKIRDAISNINKSVFGSLYNDTTFQISYSVLEPDKGSDLDRLENDDIYSFSVNSKSDINKTTISKYRHNEADPLTGEESFLTSTYSSTFVENMTGLVKEALYDIYVYDTEDADLITQRLSYIHSLSNSSVEIKTDLRLSEKSVNDKMWINLDRLYKRFGQQSSQKIGIITKIGVDENGTNVSFSDLGNIFNRTASIADNSTSDFSSATDREKMLAGFIVDDTVYLPDTTSDVESNTNLIG